MTAKDYVRLARAFRNTLAESNEPEYRMAVRSAAYQVSCECAEDNPKFDREHFMAVVNGDRDLLSKPPKKKVA